MKAFTDSFSTFPEIWNIYWMSDNIKEYSRIIYFTRIDKRIRDLGNYYHTQ